MLARLPASLHHSTGQPAEEDGSNFLSRRVQERAQRCTQRRAAQAAAAAAAVAPPLLVVNPGLEVSAAWLELRST